MGRDDLSSSGQGGPEDENPAASLRPSQTSPCTTPLSLHVAGFSDHLHSAVRPPAHAMVKS